jgi:hypothetical protein
MIQVLAPMLFGCGAAALYWLGYVMGKRVRPDPEAVRVYLDSQLGSEELERAERSHRAHMLRAGRTSVPNPNAGRPARVSSIHVTREDFRETKS